MTDDTLDLWAAPTPEAIGTVSVRVVDGGAATPLPLPADDDVPDERPLETAGARSLADVDAALYGVDLFGEPIRQPGLGPLAQRFVMPPFSVLDARGGDWQERKRAWLSLGMHLQDGMPTVHPGLQDIRSRQAGVDLEDADEWARTSTFDPVLVECVLRWWCPPGGMVLDPFGGEPTKGIVTTMLGYGYTGVELRAGQVEANQRQAARLGVAPRWVCGDSVHLAEHAGAWAPYDIVFTSPPYYDLEQYGGGDKDGSGFGSYAQFLAWYTDIFRQAVGMLGNNRFLVVKVGEIRDRATGAFRNFVGDNVSIFRQLGLHYFNDAVLVTPAGTLPVRVSAHFHNNRKLGLSHQHVLAFWKGDPRDVTKTFRTEGAGRDAAQD